MKNLKQLWNHIRGVEEPEQKQKSNPQTPDEAAEAFHQALNHIIGLYISDQETLEKPLREAIEDLVPRIDQAYVDYLRASGKDNDDIRRKLNWQVIWSMTYPPSFTHASE